MALAAPQQLMAQDRSIVDEAYAGDIIGIFDPGVFAIGDTVATRQANASFPAYRPLRPSCSQRCGRRIPQSASSSSRAWSRLRRRVRFKYSAAGPGMEAVIVGVVGVLQFEVPEYRLKNEYNVEIIRENLPYEHVRWVEKRRGGFRHQAPTAYERHQNRRGSQGQQPAAVHLAVEYHLCARP